jgi:hypothetical protein
MHHSQVTFNVNDPSFKLDDLLKLELHKFEEEVGKGEGGVGGGGACLYVNCPMQTKQTCCSTS